MSEAMLKKYGGNGLGEKPKSDASSEITLDAEEITGRVMQKMGFVQAGEGLLGNYKQYGELIDQS